MRRYLSIFSMLLWGLILASCDTIHAFPDGKDDPSYPDVRTTVRIHCKVGLPGLSTLTKYHAPISPQEDTQAHYDRRFIVCFSPLDDPGIPKAERMVIRDVADTLDLSLEVTLKAARYRMTVWMDFVRKGTDRDLFYLTGQGTDLGAIHLPGVEEYVGGSLFKDAQYCAQDVDLSGQDGNGRSEILLDAPLVRPVARMTLLATDLEEYAQAAGYSGRLEDLVGSLSLEVSYEGFFPSGFNAGTGLLNDSEPGYGFQSLGTYPYVLSQETYLRVASDYVLVNGQNSSVQISVTVRSADGLVISRVRGLTVPVTRDQETVVRYAFLTKGSLVDPGFGIDPSFAGEYNVSY